MLNRVIRRVRPRAQFHDTGDYKGDYRRHTNERVRRDPREAVGGKWDTVGPLQFEFLKGEGLKPSSTLLDIGCGTLRGGRFFIPYLDTGNYTGTDMSEEGLKAAHKLIRRDGLSGRCPNLIHVPDGNFRFEGIRHHDFLLAQSVFTHLHEPMIDECFANVRKVMGPGSRFCFTFNEATQTNWIGVKDFAYPFAFFADLGAKHGLKIESVSERYPHPTGQRMAVAYRT